MKRIVLPGALADESITYVSLDVPLWTSSSCLCRNAYRHMEWRARSNFLGSLQIASCYLSVCGKAGESRLQLEVLWNRDGYFGPVACSGVEIARSPGFRLIS